MAVPFTAAFRQSVAPVVGPFRVLASVVGFSARGLYNVPAALRYRPVIVNYVSDIAIGAGAYLLGAGAAVVTIMMTAVIGVQVGLEGFKGLELIGAEDLMGFLSAFANIREITPLAAGIIFAAQVGANFTAELGAMRISEEIDAIEVMGIPSLRYLVSTRLIAAYLTVLPLYVVGLYVEILTTKLTSTWFFDVAPGVYDQYFQLYLPREDIVYSVVKALVFTTIITFVHCAYGFQVRGGPEEVGKAVGRAVRLSITSIFVVNFALSYLFWGSDPGINFSG
jgi:phospholipid/cholesterol/gamma-HCH transport system permease protein